MTVCLHTRESALSAISILHVVGAAVAGGSAFYRALNGFALA